jgi:hypothetical protein
MREESLTKSGGQYRLLFEAASAVKWDSQEDKELAISIEAAEEFVNDRSITC